MLFRKFSEARNVADHPSDIRLSAHEVAQLLYLDEHGATWPGDLFDKGSEKTLRAKELVGRIEGWAVVTVEGGAWLRCAGLKKGGRTDERTRR